MKIRYSDVCPEFSWPVVALSALRNRLVLLNGKIRAALPPFLVGRDRRWRFKTWGTAYHGDIGLPTCPGDAFFHFLS